MEEQTTCTTNMVTQTGLPGENHRQPQVTGNFRTYPGWDSNPKSGEKQSVATPYTSRPSGLSFVPGIKEQTNVYRNYLQSRQLLAW